MLHCLVHFTLFFDQKIKTIFDKVSFKKYMVYVMTKIYDNDNDTEVISSSGRVEVEQNRIKS